MEENQNPKSEDPEKDPTQPSPDSEGPPPEPPSEPEPEPAVEPVVEDKLAEARELLNEAADGLITAGRFHLADKIRQFLA